MNFAQRMRDLFAPGAWALCAGLLAIACTFLLAPTASADDALVRDRVFGDDYVVDWSRGLWSVNGDTTGGCVTFPGGTSTGPGQTMDADSLICNPVPNAWEWTVTIPGPYTLHWAGHGLPPNVEFCVQIFFGSAPGTTRASMDFENDRFTVESPVGSVIYDGPYGSFDPGTYGLQGTEARRCGLIRLIPVPVEDTSWGKVKSLYLD